MDLFCGRFHPDDGDSPGMVVYAETVVAPFTHQPGDVIATAEHPLPFFLQDGEFAVGQVVADLLFPFHAERYKHIACLPRAE